MRIFIQFSRELGRLFLLFFAGVALCSSTAISQPYIDSVCVLTEYQPVGGHSLYLANLPGSPHERFVFDSLGGMMVFYSDSTANIIGRVVNDSLPNLQWDVNIWLENRRTFAQWKALQRQIKIELAPDSVVHANKFNWMFYEMDSTRSRLTGVPGTFYAGDTLNLTHMPADYTFGFQMGVAANSKNGNYGISGWFFYNGSYSGHGDVNANLSCSVPSCDVAIDTVATNCLSDSTFQAVVTLSGSGNNLSISDNQGTTPLTGLSAGTYNFGTYANNTSVTIFAADLNLIACADTAAPVTADCTPPPVCDVAIDSVVTNCLSDSTFQAVVTLSGSGNNLSISDNQGTTPLTGLSAGTYNFGTYANNTSVTIFAADLNLLACADTAAPVTADCTPPPVCDVAIDSVVANCVTDSTFELVVTFTGTGSSFVISDNLGSLPVAGLVAGTYLYGNYNSGTLVNVFVNDASIAGCSDNAGPFTANCAPPVCDVTFDTIYSLCVTDSTFEVVVKISGSGFNYQLEDDQGNPPIGGLSAGTYNLGPYFNSTDVFVTVKDLNFATGCSFFNGPVTADCTPVPICDVKFDSIAAICNSDSTFQIQVTISGSQNSYIISDNKGTPILPGLSPGTYTYGTYATNDSVILQVSDPGIFGCVKFSPIVTTKCDTSSSPKPVLLPKIIYMSNFFPNPADDQTSIKVFMPYVGKIRWDLVNAQGKIVAYGDVVLNPGENLLPFNTTKMLSGIYVMNFYMAGLLLDSKKLMILH